MQNVAARDMLGALRDRRLWGGHEATSALLFCLPRYGRSRCRFTGAPLEDDLFPPGMSGIDPYVWVRYGQTSAWRYRHLGRGVVREEESLWRVYVTFHWREIANLRTVEEMARYVGDKAEQLSALAAAACADCPFAVIGSFSFDVRGFPCQDCGSGI